MRKNSLKRIFAALALSAVATTSVVSISASAADESSADESSASDVENPDDSSADDSSADDSSADDSSADDSSADDSSADDSSSEDPTEAPTDAPAQKQGPTSDGGFVVKNVDGSFTTLSASEIAGSQLKPGVTVATVEGKAGAEVTLTVDVSTADWNATGLHVNYDSNLTLVKASWSDGVKDSNALGAKNISEYAGGVFFTTGGNAGAGTTNYAVLTFKVADSAKAGDFFPVSIGYVEGDIFTSSVADDTTKVLATAYTFTKGITNGGVKIPDAATPAATTAAPTTVAKATTTKAATTTKKAPVKGSPKTGVAGVGVAAAGLVVAAGAAFVLRKKED